VDKYWQAYPKKVNLSSCFLGEKEKDQKQNNNQNEQQKRGAYSTPSSAKE
jgi:hypothetical protein